jgi:RecA/RadA recombinase
MPRRKTEVQSAPSDVRDRLQRMQAVAARFSAFRPATEVLTRVRSVPTRFVQIDRATRVGGWPIERIATVHGPSNHGKTSFCHGLGLSFLEKGHYYGFIDAEYTTPETWLAELMGQQSSHPGFVAMRPTSFEQTVDGVRQFVETIGEARDKGDLEDDTTALLVVDSIRKLVPDRLIEKIAKEGAAGKNGSVDGMGGRGAMYKAALQSQWMDELVPLLASTKTAMVVIAREADDPNADARDIKFDSAWKIQGSKSLVYDASLVIRITRDSWLREGPKESAVVVGERHRARIWKTKVGGKEDRHVDAYFHTSNGVDGHVGFDRARDVFELAREFGIVESAGAWFKCGEHKWQGESKAVAALRDPALLAEIEAEVRAGFDNHPVATEAKDEE